MPNPLQDHYEILGRNRIALSSVSLSREPEDGHRWGAAEELACEELVDRRRERGEYLIVDEGGEYPVLDRLQRFDLKSTDHWMLHLGPTHYPAHLLTNVEHPEWRENKGAEVMADVLAVCALVTTNDGFAVWGKRAAQIPEGAGLWHVVPAGHPEPPQSMKQALFVELEEELGVFESEVGEGHFTGLIRSLPTLKPELTARLKLDLSWEELNGRNARDAWESETLEAIPWEPQRIGELLVERLDHFVASGHAASYLAATQDFGSAWEQDFLDKLRS